MALVEVESKRRLPETAVAELATRLTDHGFRHAGNLHESDTYYSRPDVDYVQTVECLRIRYRDGFAEITYKPSSTDRNAAIISKPETNLPIQSSDAATAHQLLCALGMVEIACVDKHRESYRHPGKPDATIVVDTIAGVGVFVETEILSRDQQRATVELQTLEQELGIDDYEVVTLPYRDLVMLAA